MKSQSHLFRASSVLAVLILLLAVSLSGTAQQPTTRQQQPVQQEAQIRELAVQELDSETLRIAVPQVCKGIVPVVQTHDVDLRKAKVDDGDLIMQPSPGEPSSNRPIGMLVNFSALKFDADIKEANHVDAAIAKLWGPQPHNPVIPLIGAVKGYVEKKDVEIGEAARKFGRTTGYTEGRIFSIYLDIWIRYDRTGQSAFFQNQFLIEPALSKFTKFVSRGDSGSLLVDAEQHAIGLIFAGMSEATESTRALPNIKATVGIDQATDKPKRIESYGVANPISEVLDRLKIELVV